MVQSSRSRALIALISGCDAPYNRCMCIPGGAGTSTTSKISARHRSHLPDHSNAQPGRHRRWCSHRGLARSSRCFWAVLRSTIVACAYPVVLVPRQHRKSVTGIVHTSRTIQTRNQAVSPAMDDGAVIEVSCVAGCTVWAVFGCTIVACAHTVVAVPKTQPQPDLGVVHTSRTGLPRVGVR